MKGATRPNGGETGPPAPAPQGLAVTFLPDSSSTGIRPPPLAPAAFARVSARDGCATSAARQLPVRGRRVAGRHPAAGAVGGRPVGRTHHADRRPRRNQPRPGGRAGRHGGPAERPPPAARRDLPHRPSCRPPVVTHLRDCAEHRGPYIAGWSYFVPHSAGGPAARGCVGWVVPRCPPTRTRANLATKVREQHQ